MDKDINRIKVVLAEKGGAARLLTLFKQQYYSALKRLKTWTR